MSCHNDRPRPARLPFALGLTIGVLGLVGAGSLLAYPAQAAGQNGEFLRAPELEPNRGWINTDRPLTIHGDLKGHVVLLDFWTYCCINCLHVLPDLEYLEEKYKDDPVVVIGVHSAKFDTEAERRSIRHAVQRYDIKHPVVVDDGFRIWRRYGARAWPSFAVIDAKGELLGLASGEGQRELLDSVIEKSLADARDEGVLADRKVEIIPDDVFISPSALRYPGKVLASAEAGRLFISDSSNDRVIVATLPDEDGTSSVIDIYGDGTRGLINGKPSLARFHDPQGMAYDHENGLLYVADTKNHAVRVIDLGSRRVSSVAGTGSQGRDRRGGLPGLEQRLSSPWALALSPDKGTLYVAMAGTHQLWSVDLSTEDRTTRNIAGSGAENVFDGPARQAALAQPSGFAFSSDGSRLYFTDTEGSAVRALNIAEDTVETIIGRAVVDPFSDSSLFDFGDIDGTYPDARLQHAIGITLMPTPAGDRLLIADTYNDKLKIVDPDAKSVVSWAGVKRDEPGGPGALRLLEPAGVSYTSNTDGAGRLFVADTNHHRIVEVDPDTKAWREVVITGLEKIDRGGDSTWLIVDPTDRGRAVGAFAPGASVSLRFDPELPGGAKVNREIPAAVRLSTLDADGKATPFEQRTLALSTDRLPDVTFEPTEPGRYLVELAFAWCTEDESICVPADLAWEVELDADGAPGAPGRVRLSASVEPL